MKKLIFLALAMFMFVGVSYGQQVKINKTFVIATRGTTVGEEVKINDFIYITSDSNTYRAKSAFGRGLTGTYLLASADRYSIVGSGSRTFASISLDPTRGSDQYQFYVDVSERTSANVFPDGGPFKTYIYNVEVDREATQDMTGDSRDVMFKGVYRNYGQNDGSSQVQGIGISVRNESGGTFSTMKGGEFGVNTKSGATSTNVIGVETTVEHYSAGSTTNLFGMKIDLRNEGAEATNQYGLIITNTDNSTANASDAAIYVTDAGTNTGWDYGVDMNSATIGIAEIRGQNGETINNITDGYWDFGASNLMGENGEYFNNATDGVWDFVTSKIKTTGAIRGTDQYEFIFDVSNRTGGIFPDGGPYKTYIYNTEVDREATEDMTGDSRDVMFKGVYRNYGQNDGSSQVQGIGISVRNESGGTFATVKAAEFMVNTKSGATSTNVTGVEMTVEHYSAGSTTNIFGAKIDLRNEGAEATNQYGLVITNTDNSTANASDAAIYVTDAGANTGWDYALDASSATIGTAEIIGQNDGTISNGTNGMWSFGTSSISILILSQDGEPSTGELGTSGVCFWIDTNDSDKIYLCINQAGTVKTIELT